MVLGLQHPVDRGGGEALLAAKLGEAVEEGVGGGIAPGRAGGRPRRPRRRGRNGGGQLSAELVGARRHRPSGRGHGEGAVDRRPSGRHQAQLQPRWTIAPRGRSSGVGVEELLRAGVDAERRKWRW